MPIWTAALLSLALPSFTSEIKEPASFTTASCSANFLRCSSEHIVPFLTRASYTVGLFKTDNTTSICTLGLLEMPLELYPLFISSPQLLNVLSSFSSGLPLSSWSFSSLFRSRNHLTLSLTCSRFRSFHSFNRLTPLFFITENFQYEAHAHAVNA